MDYRPMRSGLGCTPIVGLYGSVAVGWLLWVGQKSLCIGRCMSVGCYRPIAVGRLLWVGCCGSVAVFVARSLGAASDSYYAEWIWEERPSGFPDTTTHAWQILIWDPDEQWQRQSWFSRALGVMQILIPRPQPMNVSQFLFGPDWQYGGWFSM